MIMSLGSSLDSSRLRSMLWFNKTPLTTFSSSYSAYLAWGTHKHPKIYLPHRTSTSGDPGKPHTLSTSMGLEASDPNDFDRDHLKGWAFLNSCRLYISLCEDQFKDKQAKIHWPCPSWSPDVQPLYANSILQNEASRHVPSFLSWWDFEGGFTSKFCPKNEVTAALTKLESTRYYQERKAVDDYIDEFSELVAQVPCTGLWSGLNVLSRLSGNIHYDWKTIYDLPLRPTPRTHQCNHPPPSFPDSSV